MAGRDAFSKTDEARLRAALGTLSLRGQALILFGLHAGARAIELAALTVGEVVTPAGEVRSSIDLQRRGANSRRGGAARGRTVPLTRSVQAALTAYLQARFRGGALAREEPLFRSRHGRPLSRWQINRIVHRLAERAQCDPDRLYGAHTLRKTFARRVHERSGHDLNLTRAALGHRSVVTTLHYLQTEREQLRGVVGNMGDGLVQEHPTPFPAREIVPRKAMRG